MTRLGNPQFFSVAAVMSRVELGDVWCAKAKGYGYAGRTARLRQAPFWS